MWIDATVAGSFVTDPKASQGRRQGRLLRSPDNRLGKRGNWLWAWVLAVPARPAEGRGGRNVRLWATSKAYLDLVRREGGVGPTFRREPAPRSTRTRNISTRRPSPR